AASYIETPEDDSQTSVLHTTTKSNPGIEPSPLE
ncbi:hypothetical protein AVEN_188528-1, partial [Araneus ventricosus]